MLLKNIKPSKGGNVDANGKESITVSVSERRP